MSSQLYQLAEESPLAFATPYNEARLQLQPVATSTIVSITVQRGQAEVLTDRLQEFIGLSLPNACRGAAVAKTAVLAIRPGGWLALKEFVDFEWVAELTSRLSGCAVVTDQSGAYGLLEVRGQLSRTLLMRGMFVDLDPTRFPADAVAVTSLSHFPAVVWRSDQEDAFRVAVPRSYVREVWDWLQRKTQMVLAASAAAEESAIRRVTRI
jgi:methylglutamate dehydrogenase subunit D